MIGGTLLVVVPVALLVAVGLRFGVRSRFRKIGLVLVGTGGLALLVGPLYAAHRARAELATPSDASVDAPVAAGHSDRWLVRFVTVDDTIPGELRLLDHRSFLLRPGETGRGGTVPVAGIEPVDLEVRIEGSGDAIDSWSIQVSDRGRSYSRSSSGPHRPGGGPTAREPEQVVALDHLVRRVAGRGTAVFPASAFPPFLDARSYVLIDRAPGGARPRPFSEGAAGTIAAALSRGPEQGGPRTSGYGPGDSDTTGTLEVLLHLSLISAGAMIALFVGIVLLSRRGALLPLLVLLAPLPLAGAHRIGFAAEMAAVSSENPAIAAAAMTGIATSPLYSRTGRAELERLRRGGRTAWSGKVADRVLGLTRRAEGRRVRVDVTAREFAMRHEQNRKR